MPQPYIYLLYTLAFGAILVLLVPRSEIRRLSIYGIIFGGLMDVLMLTFGRLTGLFGWINYGPFGYLGFSIFASVSWAIYYILYFYFLPKKTPLIIIYAISGVLFSIIYTNLVIELGVFYSQTRITLPLLAFIVWFAIATYGYIKLDAFYGDPYAD